LANQEHLKTYEDQEGRFKRPHETYREEFCSQVSRQVILSRRLKTTENWRIWAQEETPCA